MSFGGITNVNVSGKGAEKMVACNQSGEILMFDLIKRIEEINNE